MQYIRLRGDVDRFAAIALVRVVYRRFVCEAGNFQLRWDNADRQVAGQGADRKCPAAFERATVFTWGLL